MGTLRTRILKAGRSLAHSRRGKRRNGHAPHEDTERSNFTVSTITFLSRNGHDPHEDTESTRDSILLSRKAGRNGHDPHEDTESRPDSIARLPSRCRNGHAPHEDTESFAADAAATLLLGSQWARSARGY